MQQKILIGLILTLVIGIFIPVYWAMEPGRQEAARLRQQTEAVARGAELYSSGCAVCHGAQGEGNIGPPLKGSQLDDDTLQKVIARGVPGTAMVAWGKEDGGPFHQQQIRDLVTFIKNWNSNLTKAPVPTLPTMPSAIDVRQLYATKCAICHGAKRQGVSGLGPALTPQSLGTKSDTEIKNTITNGRPGTAMVAWKDLLSPAEIEALLQLIKYTPP